MRLASLDSSMDALGLQCAQILVDAFADSGTPEWRDLESAKREVMASVKPGRRARVLVDQETVLGWVGAIEQYMGHVWEVHPLAVAPAHQGKGYGRALLADIESQALAAGVGTLFVGTDDENGSTSLSQENLYANVSKSIATVKSLSRHPFGFYQKMGFVITGVLPDANGEGKPDIFMAKKVVRPPEPGE